MIDLVGFGHIYLYIIFIEQNYINNTLEYIVYVNYSVYLAGNYIDRYYMYIYVHSTW